MTAYVTFFTFLTIAFMAVLSTSILQVCTFWSLPLLLYLVWMWKKKQRNYWKVTNLVEPGVCFKIPSEPKGCCRETVFKNCDHFACDLNYQVQLLVSRERYGFNHEPLVCSRCLSQTWILASKYTVTTGPISERIFHRKRHAECR